jgi:hypothetical protein
MRYLKQQMDDRMNTMMRMKKHIGQTERLDLKHDTQIMEMKLTPEI